MKTFLIVAFAGLALVSVAAASPIVCATGENLQDVITAGGCTLGDLLFTDIVYQNNQIAGTPAIIPASQVNIVVGSNPSELDLQGPPWLAKGTQELQIIFNYTLTSASAPITGLGSGYAVSGPNAVGQTMCQSGCAGSPLDFSNTTGLALSQPVAPNTPINITNTVTLGASAPGSINHGSVIINSFQEGTALPDPAPMGLVLGGLLALAGTRYWKKKKIA